MASISLCAHGELFVRPSMWCFEVAVAVALMSHLAASVGKCFGDAEETETEMVQLFLSVTGQGYILMQM